MNIEIRKDELLKILKFSEKIIDLKTESFNPILSCLKIYISKQGSTATCTNGTMSGIYEINNENLKIEEYGKIHIKNKLLLEIVSKLNDEFIQLIKIENSVLLIKTKSFTSQINITEDKFPIINFSFSEFPCFKLEKEKILKIVKKNGSCTFDDQKQIKPISGIYFSNKIEKNKLTTLSTDSFKLSYLNTEFNDNIEKDIQFIINPSTLNIASQIFKNNSLIEFYIDEVNKKNIIKCENIILIDRSINGDYPVDIFLNAFNIDAQTQIKISKQELIEGLEISKIVVNNESNPSIIIEANEKELNLIASSLLIGNSKKEISIKEYSGIPIKICFNISFLLTLLKNIDSNIISIKIQSNSKPTLIEGVEENNFKELILPIKISN